MSRVLFVVHLVRSVCAVQNGDDVTQLMQAHSQDSSFTSSTIAELQQLVDEAVHDGAPISALNTVLTKISRNDPGSWGASEKQTLADVLTDVETDMQKFLENEHKDDEAYFADAKTLHDECYSHNQVRFAAGGDVIAEKERFLELGVKHRKCRKMEKSFNDYKQAAASCSASTFAPYAENVAHTDLVTKILQLRDDTTSHDEASPPGPSSDCPLSQASFESQYCTWRTSKRFACLSEAKCVETVGLESEVARLNKRSENRRKLLLTLKKITCRVKHLLTTFDGAHVSNFTGTDTCDGQTVDATKFELSMEVTKSAECNNDAMVSIKPSTDPAKCQQWREEMYSGSDWSSVDHVVPSVCKFACTDETPTFRANEECTDADAKCSFFRYHQDACDLGVYNTSSFDPKQQCCGCKDARPVANLALNKPVTASSDHYGTHTRKLLVDGDLSQTSAEGIAHTNYERDAWFSIDLGADHWIDNVVVYNGWSYCCGARMNPVRIILTNSGGTETGRITGIVVPACGDGTSNCAKTVYFDGKQLAQHVKIQLDDHTNYLHPSEVQVWGK